MAYLGKLSVGTFQNIRLLKVVLNNKKNSSDIILAFNSRRKNNSVPMPNFKIVRDKTRMERELLRTCYTELDAKAKSGDSDLDYYLPNR